MALPSYGFDRVFGPDEKTVALYSEMCEPMVRDAMTGKHATVFAYGQTASGKTHTMMGTAKADSIGVIPLAVADVFDLISANPGREFLLRVSYLEIYNEVINDLLDQNNNNLRIREHKQTGIYVDGLKEEVVVSAEQVMAILSMGEASRKYGATSFNETSSRSHTIFRMVIESRDRSDQSEAAPVRRSVLSLIDLAGSEKVGRSTSTGQRAKEGLSINKSLLTLGTVINKLSDPRQAKGHIPYRDSKLTRILQPSLSGNARVCLICTAALPAPNADETHSTLKFASRAKTVQVDAKTNEVRDESAMLKKMQNEIATLKTQLEEREKLQEIATEQEAVQGELMDLNEEMAQKLMEQEEAANVLKEKLKRLTKLILTAKENGTDVLADADAAGFALPTKNETEAEAVARLKQEVFELNSKISTLESTNESIVKELTFRDKRITLMTQTQTLLTKNLKDEKARVAEKDKTIEELNIKLSADALDTSKVDEQDSLAEASYDLQLAKKQNAQLKEQLDAKEEAVSESLDMLEDMEVQMRELEAENERKTKLLEQNGIAF